MLSRLVPLLALSLVASNACAQVVMKFGGGAGEVTIPSYYGKIDDKDASLVVVSKPEGNVRLYFDLHKLDRATHVPNPGEAVIREQAAEKKKDLKRRGNKVAFFDPSAPSLRDGRTHLNFHWQIGFGKTVVVMSASLPQDAREQPDVKRFFSGDIESIIDSLRRVDG